MEEAWNDDPWASEPEDKLEAEHAEWARDVKAQTANPTKQQIRSAVPVLGVISVISFGVGLLMVVSRNDLAKVVAIFPFAVSAYFFYWLVKGVIRWHRAGKAQTQG